MSTPTSPCTSLSGQFHGKSAGDVATFDHIVYASASDLFAESALRTQPSQHIGNPEQSPLLLRVTTPADTTQGEDMPVVALIHGGGFENGSRNEHWFGGDGLAKQRVIMVSIDYRLQFPGFVRFHDEQPDFYRGISDCQVALDWIQRNIEDFGGDPTNVTLIGQSAGATIALWLARRDHFKGTFRRVMALSPAFARTDFYQRKGLARFALGRGITRSSLKNLSPQKLARGYRKYRKFIQTDLALGPVGLDGQELADIPIIISCTREEWYASTTTARIDHWLPRSLRPLLANHFNANARYLDATTNTTRFFAQLIGDSAIRRWVDRIASSTPGNTWVMHYIGSEAVPAVHCSDIPWVLNSEAQTDHHAREYIAERADATVQQVRGITDAFLQGNLPTWRPYRSSREVLELNITTGQSQIVHDPFAHLREGFYS
ncbi:carboxylesterase family protein [Corynebacterium gerontici]|uniref:carboxylesterase family protein n=1 Tax=Corynebacterium gerontici TaxID=2079234 RepID=UPI0013DE318B